MGNRPITIENIVIKDFESLEKGYYALLHKRATMEITPDYEQKLTELALEEVELACSCLNICTNGTGMVNDSGKIKLKKWIDEFCLADVLTAIEIAMDRYYQDTTESLNEAFNKIGGICHNKRHQKPSTYYFNYMRKVCLSAYGYCNEKFLFTFSRIIETDDDFDVVKDMLKAARSWTQFRDLFFEYFFPEQ